LRRFAISRNGAERFANEIPPTTSFRGARLAVFVLLAVAAVSAGGLIFSTRGGEDVGLWWLGPVVYVAVAFLTAAAFFGMHARLPASSPHHGGLGDD
jgi:fatty acid desaturase